MPAENLRDLLIEHLKDTYDAEKQLVKALPQMAKGADSEELRDAFTEHLEVTKGQVARLEEVFKELGVPARGKHCAGMEGLLSEGKEVLEEDNDAAVKDAALIAAAQKVEHYEISAYGTGRTWANLLGLTKVANLLEESLEEEAETDEALSELAQSINVMAEAGAEGDSDGEDGSPKAGKSAKSGKSAPSARSAKAGSSANSNR